MGHLGRYIDNKTALLPVVVVIIIAAAFDFKDMLTPPIMIECKGSIGIGIWFSI